MEEPDKLILEKIKSSYPLRGQAAYLYVFHIIMQKGINLLFGLLFAMAVTAQNKTSQEKVAALLRQMTLDEKIGQMTQVTLGVVAAPEDGVLNPEALAKTVTEPGDFDVFIGDKKAMFSYPKATHPKATP